MRYHALLQLFLLIWCCAFMFSAAIDTIRANESLKDSEFLVSNGNNRFKLGFFSPPNSTHRYVGIMFDLPLLTVVWVANRNNPLNDSSGTFEISSDGNLVILDGRKAVVWSTGLSTSVASSSSRAVLLDTGNLVLQDDDSVDDGYVWESFLRASDSILENMRISTDLNRNERNMLTSWRSPDDPAPGGFTLTLEPLDVPQAFVWKDGDPYWRSGPWNGQIFTGMPDMRSDYGYGINVVSDSPGIAYQVFTLPNSSALLYTFLNSSGSIEEKVWSDEKKGWEITWSSTSNECNSYGKCGPFGSCNSDKRPFCTCLRGFVPKSIDEWDAGNWTGGCTRRTPLRCEHNSTTGKQDEFLKVERVKLPDHYKWFSAKEDCMGACLSSCSCIAYADASGIGCLHWTRNLTDTQKFTNGGDDLYIRLAHSEIVKKQNRRTIIVTTVVLGFIFAVVCAYFFLKKLLSYRAGRRKSGLIFSKTKGENAIYSEESIFKHDKHGVKFEELHVFQLQMLSNATGNFDSVNELGQGGFGLVYKGKLPNGVEIAVKRLSTSSNQGVEEFMNEVELISRLQHRNLVKLVGCCVESEEKMLVYEYMHNGSLDAYLFGSNKHEFLNWQTRKSIIEGICRGLLYLHRDSRLKVIHRDLKASNILLDAMLIPKISDFGMARIFGGEDIQANTTRVVGTYGYMSPEYALRGIFSEKSDVYSFGVLLLEIVSGKKNSSFHDDDQQIFLTAYAWKLWTEGKIVNLVDPAIAMYDDGFREDDVVRYANVGLLCVQESAADRPDTGTVLSMLRCEIVELPRPKQPAFLGMQSFQGAQTCAESWSKCTLNDVTISIVEGR